LGVVEAGLDVLTAELENMTAELEGRFAEPEGMTPEPRTAAHLGQGGSVCACFVSSTDPW
jgi:hypothetical protein